jgi:hypothetical protein
LFLRADRARGQAASDAEPLIDLGSATSREEVLDLAAVETLRHGGAVYAVTRARMPETTWAAATLRY